MNHDTTATQDRYNRVTYIDFPIPLDFFVKDRRARINNQPVMRNPHPTGFLCRTCGKRFTVPKGAKTKKVNGKVYPRKFCSRACYGKSIVGNTFKRQKEETRHENQRHIAG